MTTALVLSIPAASLAAPAADQHRGVAAGTAASGRHYTPAEATQIFNKLQSALAPKPLVRRKLGDPLPRQDVTLLMRDAQAARGSMTARQASIIDGGRPVTDSSTCADKTQGIVGLGGTKWTATESAHFCVHYNDDPNGAAGVSTPDQATRTLTELEYVYAREINGLHYRAPLPDHDGKTDVFLDNLGASRYYGFCKSDPGNTATRTAWCALDNDFSIAEFGATPINSLRVTAAHEFFHAIQFGYDLFEDDWFMEGTAVWMEDQVYPNINDYLQYLPDSQIVKPLRSSDSTAGASVYGSVTFWKFLSERFRDVDIIRQVWNSASVAAGSRRSVAAVTAVLRTKGTTMAPEFARYGVWNTLPPGTYGDRSRFPAPGLWAAGTLTRKSRDTGVLAVRLNHLTTAPLRLRPGTSLPGRTKLAVTVNGPNTSRNTQARIQLRYKSGKVVYYKIGLNGYGNGTKVVPFNPGTLKFAIVTMSNGGGYDSQTFKIRARARY